MSNMPNSVRSTYPILAHQQDKPLVYLDSAATALKPQAVIDAVVDVLTQKTANIHRSVHYLGDLATEAFENSRSVVADFIGADAHEIVFVRNTTEALNLVANSWPDEGVTVVSLGEHHSNLLPWRGKVRQLQPGRNGQFDRDALHDELRKGDVRMVAVNHVSNVLGIRNDVAELADLCHAHGALLVVDAAQSVPHEVTDVYELNCDFLAFSGHKLGSPTGVGALFGKAEHLDRMQFYQRGGSTVEQVHADRIIPKDMPWRLEAGTPAVESVVGLAAAIQFLQSVGMGKIRTHQYELAGYCVAQIRKNLPALSILGPSDEPTAGPVSVVQRTVSPHLIARGLSDGYRICVRSGYHCAQPLHEALGVPASLRLSFYLYNTVEEIDLAVEAIGRLLAIDT
jgi:cysteine desulfurase / selenocysteine lyase